MSSVVTSRTTPTKESSPVTPPMTSADKSAKVVDKDTPIDIDIPDNYVSWTLKNQKARPPITWDNWWKELNYLSLSILTITPAIAIYGALTQPLRWQTAVFSVFYYFVTGLGESSLHFSRSGGNWLANPNQASLLATTVSGRTAHTTRRSRSSTSSPWRALAPSRVPSSGGREVTVLTIVTPTPTSTPTVLTTVSFGRTSAGCLSSLAGSLVSPT